MSDCVDLLTPLIDSLIQTGGKASGDDTKKLLKNCAVNAKINETDCLSLANTCRQISQAADIAFHVHIRGCNVGKCSIGVDTTKWLRQFQKLFRSMVVTAPTCPMFYTRVSPGAPHVKSVDSFAASKPPAGRRFIYTSDTSGPMLLDIRYWGDTAPTLSAVENSADIQRWARVMYERPSVTALSSFVVAGTWPDNVDFYALDYLLNIFFIITPICFTAFS
jgi:hypothetical protein